MGLPEEAERQASGLLQDVPSEAFHGEQNRACHMLSIDNCLCKEVKITYKDGGRCMVCVPVYTAIVSVRRIGRVLCLKTWDRIAAVAL